MTAFPGNKHLTDYPYIDPGFPFHLSLNRIEGRFPAHRHDFLEFSLVTEGEGTETVNGGPHAMRPGVFTLLLPYQVHEISAKPGSALKLYNLMFDLGLLLPILREEESMSGLLFAETEESPYVTLEGQQREGMEAVFRDMLQEYRGEGEARTFLLRLKLAEVLLRFHRARAGPGQVRPVRNASSANVPSVWPVIRYIHTHYREELQLARLAERFGYHPSKLSEAIKRQAGIPFTKLLHEVRLRHACSLLASTDMRMLDVALEAGFGSFQTFNRLFRVHKGVTPTEYRSLMSGRRSEAAGREPDGVT
ncbi:MULTISPECIES: AraC family transcriptional regulator [Paenibacillus]|uniref:AraC family transcriptional regulator n=1 Tax=Paenibacillus TaxID=44249 RepID=UPI0022B8E06E|nr:AraC family transcriptional regulator [Paenibacillus caseinilyticus]MCZ8518085.1 AraC family transcriptional regulator [Paenibacillus caseinilyticus]